VLEQARPARARPASRLARLARHFDVVFALCVLTPTLLATLYYGVVASDVYISESRFVVRSPQRPMQTGLGALLQGTVFSRSQDDTYSVHDFIRSRDALGELEEKMQLRRRFTAPTIDWVNRYPGLAWWEDSFETFHQYYQRHVAIEYDSVSSISTLRVRAYSAEDAQRISELLLQMGERLVNNLNTRSRQDLIEVAEREVRQAEERAKSAAAALSSFRADRAVFDPDRQGALQLQSVARLQEELLAARTQLAQVRQVAPDNPQLGTLTQRVQALERAVEAETARVVGRGSSLTAKSPAFDRLVLEKTFADRQLASTLASLETARSEAARKQLYLERLVQPNRPDEALEPRRLRSIVVVFVLGLVAWGVVSLVVAGVREHAD
jgi:capsular polysaccharide transport system permease protein